MLAIACIVLVSAGIVVWGIDRSEAQDPTRDAVVAVPAEAREVSLDGSMTVTLEPIVGEGRTLSIQREGVITAIRQSAGDLLSGGDPILEVDNRTIYAFDADEPLWRDFADGVIGEDVRGVQEFLAAEGVLDSDQVDGEYGSVTRKAWQQLRSRDGVEASDVADPGPGDFIWLPNGRFSVARVLVSAGDRVVSGDDVLVAPQEIERVDVTESESAPPVTGREWVVVFEGAEWAYDREKGVIADEVGVAILTEDETIEATAQYRNPIEGLAVPASAVILDGSSSCVVAVGPPRRTHLVKVVVGGLGATTIERADIDKVIANPGALGLLSCSG